MMNRCALVAIAVLLAMACRLPRLMPYPPPPAETNLLDSLLRTNPAAFENIVAHRDSFRVQIVYTKIDRNQYNQPSFTDYSFNLNNHQYFYPASTVKMPVALLALEKLNELKVPGVDRTTAMITDSSYHRQQHVFTEPLANDGRPTIEQYIKEIFLVSDNEAYNRLYEFLGQEYLNERLHQKGYRDAEILHRLSVSMSEDENRHTNAISFVDTSGNLLYHQPAAYNTRQYSQRNTMLGKGYFTGGTRVNNPFDFSKKNRVYLYDLHNILRSVIFPDAVDAAQRFNLTPADYRLLYRYMSAYPRESNYPQYDSAQYYDAYVKFLLYGSQKGPLPPNIRIFNKVGDAYGFLTDVAYVADLENNVEFMLSATIFCNSKGLFNSNDYEYETVGFPFLKALGQVIYNYEKTRKRTFTPNLQAFKIDYSK